MKTVFIDGSAGTTGLNIHARLSKRAELRLLQLPEAQRKDVAARREIMNQADIVFLCLPDEASREAVTLIDSGSTVVIDTSTAHRVRDDWTYGFPEILGLRASIAASKRIANPGCHASGFIALVAPLAENGLIPHGAALSAFSLTGFSGGGKKMIAQYGEAERGPLLDAPRMYGLTQQHKHLPEMKKYCSLEKEPIFCPVVADYYSGMEVTVPLFAEEYHLTLPMLRELYRDYYHDGVVRFVEDPGEGGFLSANAFSGRDDMEITVWGNEERILLTSRFDNLGKGACGAAIQNMNLVLGADEAEGLVIGNHG